MFFGDVLTAMLTPFKEDGSVNYDKACELADYLLDHGSDGIIAGATTGENPTLSREEMQTLYRELKSAVGNKGKILGGAGGNNTADIIRHIEACNKIGLDGYLSVVPYYNKPPKNGLVKHFKAIDAASECPVMLYNVPGRTGLAIDPDIVEELANCPNISAVKESTGSIDGFSRLLRQLPEDFHVYSGDDYMTLPAVAMGACGVVSVASHIMGKEIKEMIVAAKNGEMSKAAKLHLDLYPMFKGLFKVTSPVPVKTAMNMLGFELGGFRLPLCEADEETEKFVKELLEQYGLLK